MIESRINKSFRNAKINLIYFIVNAILLFFARSIFLEALGEDFVGSSSVLINFLGLLNLAELGVGTSIAYMLYKPLHDHNYVQISAIISALGYLYRWIGMVILLLGVILAFFLDSFMSRSGVKFDLILFLYCSLFISSLLSYFFNYKQILFSADQRGYELYLYFRSATIVKVLMQIIVCKLYPNYYLWISLELIFGFVSTFLLSWRVKKVYPWLIAPISLGRNALKQFPLIKENTKRIFVHKLAGVALFQTTPLFIYSYSSIQDVTKYTNYLLITSCISALIAALYGGVSSAVGNLVAEGDGVKIFQLYQKIFALRIMVSTFIVTCLYLLTKSFIALWLGYEFILPSNSFILILCNVYILNIRGTTDDFINAFGLFRDTAMPILEALIFFASAVLLGRQLGLNGVLIAGVISQVIVVLGWKPLYLFKCGLKESIVKYILQFIFLIALSILSLLASVYASSYMISPGESGSLVEWVKLAILVSVLSIFCIVIIFIACSNVSRQVIRYIAHYVLKKVLV